MNDADAAVSRVAVIIPNWNGARHLPVCLDSLARQSFTDFEVWVVDNGSTDDSLDILARYPDVRVLRRPTNAGFAPAVNEGIRRTRSALIALLNNDTEADRDWLKALTEAMDATPTAGMATSKVRLFDRRDHLHTTGDTLSVAGWPANRGVWELDRGQWDDATSVFGANGAAAAYRRTMLDDVGLLEERFGSYMEDVDLAWRAQLAGWGCLFVPEAIVYHHVSATGGGAYASFYVARNRVWLIARNYPARLLLRHGRAVAIAQLGEAWSALKAWRGEAARATLRGLVVGWLTWPWMLASRRRIQGRRRISDDALERLMAAG